MNASVPVKFAVVCTSLALTGGYVAYRHFTQVPPITPAANTAPPTDEKPPLSVMPGSKSMVITGEMPINRNNIDAVLNNPSRGNPPGRSEPGTNVNDVHRSVLPGSKSAGIFEPTDTKADPTSGKEKER